LNKRIELSAQAGFPIPFSVQIVEQFVHEDEHRHILGQKLPDYLRGRRDALSVMRSNYGEAFFVGKLKRNVAPRRAAQWRPVVATATS
jgi:hypothetical protein